MRLVVERMAYGSDAICHTEDGKTIFLAGGVPGDVVEAEVTEDCGSFFRARVTKLLDASPQRVDAACPYADFCGGCPWARLDRLAQLQAKRSNVVEALVRIGHVDPMRAEELVGACEDPGPAWGYRNKLELAVGRRAGKAFLGMHAPGGKDVVKVESCPLLDKRHAKLVKAVSGAVSYLANSRRLDFERVALRVSSRTKDVEVALWTEPGPFPRGQVAKVLGDATKASSVVRVLTKGPRKARRVTGVERLSGKGHWSERIAGGRMSLSAPSFFQVNTAGAERLVELVLHGLSPTEDDEAMDLYCGAGTFTLPLARSAGFVSAVESSGPAVRDLARNLEHSGLTNVDAVGGDAGREFPETDADIIVVDPPRAGLSAEVVQQLSNQPARAIAYVSCDPATLARDLARFAEVGSFEPKSIRPVDLFPQTFHVESVSFLMRIR